MVQCSVASRLSGTWHASLWNSNGALSCCCFLLAWFVVGHICCSGTYRTDHNNLREREREKNIYITILTNLVCPTLHTYIPTCLPTYIPASCLPAYLHTYTPAFPHTCIHASRHPYIPAYLTPYLLPDSIPTDLPTYLPTYLYWENDLPMKTACRSHMSRMSHWFRCQASNKVSLPSKASCSFQSSHENSESLPSKSLTY